MINKISEDFYCITLPMPFRLKHVHVYVMVDGKNVTLFDTGLNAGGSYEILEKDLMSIGLGIESVRDIYITHVHGDHCGMAGLIKEETGAAIHISAAADDSHRNYLQTGELIRKMKKFYAAHGLTEDEIDELIAIFGGFRNVISPFQSDDRLQEGDVRKIGKLSFQVIFTPGHSNGHLCYYFKKEGFLLSGDAILPHITPNLSPDLFDENFRPLSSFLESIKKVAGLSVNRVYPGHGNALPDIKQRVAELAAHHAERTQLILDCLGQEPKTTCQISHEIFGGGLSDFDKFLAVNETYVHLLELKLKGMVKENYFGGNLVYLTEK